MKDTNVMQKLKGKTFPEWLICIKENIKITGFQFRWSCGAFIFTHRMLCGCHLLGDSTGDSIFA